MWPSCLSDQSSRSFLCREKSMVLPALKAHNKSDGQQVSWRLRGETVRPRTVVVVGITTESSFPTVKVCCALRDFSTPGAFSSLAVLKLPARPLGLGTRAEQAESGPSPHPEPLAELGQQAASASCYFIHQPRPCTDPQGSRHPHPPAPRSCAHGSRPSLGGSLPTQPASADPGAAATPGCPPPPGPRPRPAHPRAGPMEGPGSCPLTRAPQQAHCSQGRAGRQPHPALGSVSLGRVLPRRHPIPGGWGWRGAARLALPPPPRSSGGHLRGWAGL